MTTQWTSILQAETDQSPVAATEALRSSKSMITSGHGRRGRRRRVSDTIVVSQEVPGVDIRRRSRPLWQHRGVPSLPVAFQPFEYVFLPVLEIGPLTRVSHNIEEKLVSRYSQIFPIPVADGTLRSRFIAPAQLPRMRPRAASQDLSEVLTIGWISRVRRRVGSTQQGRHPVHRDHDLFGHRSRGDPSGPAHNRGNANATFEQLMLMPENGHTLENRSPPLSLVRMTMVLLAKPFASSACSRRPILTSRLCTIARRSSARRRGQ